MRAPLCANRKGNIGLTKKTCRRRFITGIRCHRSQIDICNKRLYETATYQCLNPRRKHTEEALLISRCNADRLAHTNELFKELYILKFPEFVQYKTAILMFHLFHGKTNYMLFRSRPPDLELHLKINNADIPKVTATKFLGIIIDDRLNWKPHIQSVKSKLSCIIIVYYV